MTKPGNILNEDEVRQISSLIGMLNESTFDHLHLEVGELKLTLSKGSAAVSPANHVAPNVSLATSNVAPAVAPPPPQQAPVRQLPDDGSIVITAPLIGRFYSQPEPGASPFVSIGSEVEEDTTIALIEAMKMFNAVRAGVSGVITEICVQDAALVEFGQVLYRIRPKSHEGNHA